MKGKPGMIKKLGWVFGLGLLVGVWRTGNMSEIALTASSDPHVAQEQVERLFRERQPIQAYHSFVELYAKSDNLNLTHNLAHWVGEYFYKHLGVEGVSICDEQFNYGCYHGFYGRAFSQEGPELVPIAQAACEGKKIAAEVSGCIHGIGHGILAYFGYSLSELKKALDLCDQLTGTSAQEGCYNGVLMEFNTRVMQAETATIRTLEKGRELQPCDILDKVEHRAACYFEQPAWWASTGVILDDYKLLCEKIKDPVEKRSCVLGTYRMVAVVSGFELEKATAYCNKIANMEDRYTCVTKVGEVLLTNNVLNGAAICDIMSETRSDECLEYLNRYNCKVRGVCEK